MLHFSFYQSRSVTLKYALNAFAAGALPRTRLGSSRCSPIPSHHTQPPRRLRCLDPRTFGARLSATPTGFLTNRTLDRPHNSFQTRAPKNLNPALGARPPKYFFPRTAPEHRMLGKRIQDTFVTCLNKRDDIK